MFLGLPDPDPDPLVRDMDPAEMRLYALSPQLAQSRCKPFTFKSVVPEKGNILLV